MPYTNFTGTLNPNEIFGGIYNMIISQHVFADNIKGTYGELAEMCRVDGSMYGDTKLYYSVDVLKTHDWLNDMEAQNLLALDRPADPSVQKITIDKFRQIRLTVDNYLTKRAWIDDSAFSSFNSIMLGMIRETKRVFDSTLVNSFIGTNETNKGKQTKDITPIVGQNDALTMAEALAKDLVDLKDITRDYNDYGYLRSFNEKDLIVIWNTDHYTALKKVDMPTIFHTEGLLTEFEQKVLPARYFGKPVGSVHSNNFTVTGDGVYRALVERDLNVNGDTIHVYPGEKLPNGTVIPEDEVYEEDSTIAYKIMHKKSVPYMSGFEVASSFFNARSLTENSYLTFGYNTLEHLAQYPFITRRFAESA